MLAEQRLVAFVATRDGSRALPFYRDTLGLALVSDDPFALVFDVGGTQLRIQKAAGHQPLPYTALGWRVRDIATEVDALVTRGVSFERFAGMDQDARGVWLSPSGSRVAWFKDPDGNVLSLTQP